MNFAANHRFSAAPAITVIGDVGIDLVMGPLAGWPEPGTETLMAKSEMRAGGSAGNTALAVRSLGAPVRLVSTLGNDPLGEWLKHQFEDIDTEFHVNNSATSTSVGLLHAGGERNFFTTRGHLEVQSWDQLAPSIPTAAPGAIALLTGVFLLPKMRRQYAEIISSLRDLGYAVAIDTGWPPEGFTPDVISEVKTWLALADHVLLNELEITRLAGSDDLDMAMTTLKATLRPGATLVAKVGQDGAIGWRGDEKAVARPPFLEDVFDTIGAGDAFNAGYLHAITKGTNLGAALAAGCETATRIIAHFPRSQKETTWQTGG